MCLDNIDSLLRHNMLTPSSQPYCIMVRLRMDEFTQLLNCALICTGQVAKCATFELSSIIA